MSTIDPWPEKLNARKEFFHCATVHAHVVCDGRELIFSLEANDNRNTDWAVEIETEKGLVVRFDEPVRMTLRCYGKNGSEPFVFRRALRWIADKVAFAGKRTWKAKRAE